MRSRPWSAAVLTILAIGVASPAAASNHEQTVTATVTAIVVSVSVSPTSLAYGSVSLGSSNNTPTPASFSVNNTGSVAVSLAVRGADTAAWALVASTPAANQYRHKVSTTVTFTSTTNLATTNQTLVANLGAGAAQSLWLRLDAPSSTASTAQQSAAVTVVATAA